MYPPVEPIIFQIGPLALRWYGILLVTGMILAAWTASRYVARHGEDGEKIWDMLVWVLIPGLIGARLYYVFVQSPRGPEGLGHFLAGSSYRLPMRHRAVPRTRSILRSPSRWCPRSFCRRSRGGRRFHRRGRRAPASRPGFRPAGRCFVPRARRPRVRLCRGASRSARTGSVADSDRTAVEVDSATAAESVPLFSQDP